MILVLAHAEMLVDLVHTPGVKEHQNNKADDGALVREPEPDINTTEGDVRQCRTQENGNSVPCKCPHDKTHDDQAKVRLPVRLCHFFIDHNCVLRSFLFSALQHHSRHHKASGAKYCKM